MLTFDWRTESRPGAVTGADKSSMEEIVSAVNEIARRLATLEAEYAKSVPMMAADLEQEATPIEEETTTTEDEKKPPKRVMSLKKKV